MLPPRGTKDYYNQECVIINIVIEQFTKIFQIYNAKQVDTPIFEDKILLLAKYGEEANQLIYEIKDSSLALRYDHTVPLVRFALTNNLTSFRRYTIGKVYRRDNLSRNQIRLREFTQCDFDIVGEHNIEWNNEEVLNYLIDCIKSCYTDVEIIVRINDKQFLLNKLAKCGVRLKEIKPICSALDKLDKVPKDKVRLECLEKGIYENVWAQVDTFISTQQLIPLYLQTTNLAPYLQWDSSLVRGLDYYTGLIFEVVVKSGDQMTTIAAGGRYDNLFETLGGRPRQCVGFSIGLDRFLQFYKSSHLKKTVCIGLIRILRLNGISSQIIPTIRNDFKKQLKWALESNITYIGWIGENELKNNKIRVKDLALKTESDMTINELVDLF